MGSVLEQNLFYPQQNQTNSDKIIQQNGASIIQSFTC